MIINGGSRRSVGFWTKHLLDLKANDRAEIREIRTLLAEELGDGLLEMKGLAQGTRCSNFFYQANINPRENEALTPEEWTLAVDTLEKHLGFTGQPRIVIEHEKNGRIHQHVLWSRIDTDNMRALPDSLTAKKHAAAAREIEWELGLERTFGPFDKDREGPRPDRAPKSWETFREQRSGIDPRAMKEEVTELFRASGNPRRFADALEEHGYMLLKGDRRDFCIMDGAGDVHSLARRIDGVKAAELRAFMRGIDRDTLPGVAEARADFQDRRLAGLSSELDALQDQIAREERLWEDRLQKAAIEKEKVERRFVEPGARHKEARAGGGRKETEQGRTEREPAPAPELGKTQGEIRLAYSLTRSGQGFASALEDRGFILARVTAEDIENEKKKDAERAKESAGQGRLPVWMEQRGGVDNLTPDLRASAQRSYDAWTGDKKRNDFEDYVSFVQRKWEQNNQTAGLGLKPGELVVVNPFGGVTRLTERNTGDDAKARAEHLAGIDRAPLLSVTDAKQVMQDVRDHRRDEWLHSLPAPKGVGAQIRAAMNSSDNARSFAAALKDKNLQLAVVTPAEARWIHAGNPYLQEPGKFAPKSLAPGEVVVLTGQGHLYQLNARNTGKTRAQIESFMAPLERKDYQGVDATRLFLQARAELRDIKRQAFRDASAIGLLKRPAERAGRGGGRLPSLGKAAGIAAKIPTRAVGKTLDFVAAAFESLLVPQLTPEQKREAQITAREREAEAEASLDLSRATAERTQQRRQEETDREAERQRERDGGGRQR